MTKLFRVSTKRCMSRKSLIFAHLPIKITFIFEPIFREIEGKTVWTKKAINWVGRGVEKIDFCPYFCHKLQRVVFFINIRVDYDSIQWADFFDGNFS